MFLYVGIVMGVVALIQCQPLNVHTTAVDDQQTPSKDHNDGSKIEQLSLQGASDDLVVTDDEFWNPIEASNLKYLILTPAVIDGNRRGKRDTNNDNLSYLDTVALIFSASFDPIRGIALRYFHPGVKD